MQLPEWLRDAVEEIAGEVPYAELSRAAAELSDAYRGGDLARAPLHSAARRAAYLAVRLPATYAACRRVFDELRRRAPELQVQSVLDLGAGPGTATFAALETWSGIERATLVERDAGLIEAGRRAAENAAGPALRTAAWLPLDLTQVSAAEMLREPAPGGFDLVVVSYALGELSSAAQRQVVAEAWKLSAGALALLEPGTPRGFASILAAREALGAAGAHIAAPCPRTEAHPCPMAEARDWCHFAARVERTSLHRRLKGGALGYEDEKYSYAVFSRQPAAVAAARIVRRPVARKGHIELQLCTPRGLEAAKAGKRDRERFRAARHAGWGDAWIGD